MYSVEGGIDSEVESNTFQRKRNRISKKDICLKERDKIYQDVIDICQSLVAGNLNSSGVYIRKSVEIFHEQLIIIQIMFSRGPF